MHVLDVHVRVFLVDQLPEGLGIVAVAVIGHHRERRCKRCERLHRGARPRKLLAIEGERAIEVEHRDEALVEASLLNCGFGSVLGLDGKGVERLSVDAFERPGDADPVAVFARLGLDYRLLLDGTELARAYRVSALPTLYLIDRAGEVALARRGFDDDFAAQLERRVAELLEER